MEMDHEPDDNPLLDHWDEDTDFLYENGLDNAAEFTSAWNSNVGDFLKREEYIPVRSTALSQSDIHSLDIVPDIDGISIRWKSIGKGLSLDFTHMNIQPREAYDIKQALPVIKKHINLREYSSNGIKNLKHAVGYQMIYHAGWETWLIILPKQSNNKMYSSEEIRTTFCGTLNEIHSSFKKELSTLLEKRIATKTLAKNNLMNVKRMFVLPGDQTHILCALERAVDSVTEDVKLKTEYDVFFFTFRFGEKCQTDIVLPIYEESHVREICVHIGINVINEYTDLFWSRDGINTLVGRRGRLTTAMSMFECVNFQSNLDDRQLDVSRELLEISRFPEKVRFVQLYTDTPHRRPKTKVHPVTASVIFSDGILRAKSQRAINRDALEYISETRNNFMQLMECNGRLEFVLELPEVHTNLRANDFMNKEALVKLLINKPMVVAFDREDNQDHFKKVGMYLCEQLFEIYRTRRGTGDHDAVWNAYQYECALEKMIWGGPFCPLSNVYSVNLGVGLSYPSRSLTDSKGFLCLEDSSVCCVDESTTPTLSLFSKNLIVQKQITRMFGLYNMKEASRQVLGRRVMYCVLKDLFKLGNVFMRFEEFLLTLKRSPENIHRRCVGGITREDLTKKLSNVKKTKWPMVFESIKRVLDMDSDSFSDTLNQGITSLQLDYFPAVRVFDESRHEGMNWKYNFGVWVILDNDSDGQNGQNFEKVAESVHVLVLGELEKRKICHTSQYQTVKFPWMKEVLRKLSDKKLSKEDTVLVLAFVSSIALLMNGYFIDYLNLRRLERQLPLTQLTLRMCEVLCKSRLGNVNTCQLYRLHPSIPHKIYSKNEQKKGFVTRPQEQNVNQTEIIRDIDEVTGMDMEETSESNSDQIVIVQSKHIASNRSELNWTAAEIKLLEDIMRNFPVKTPKVRMYREYQKKCREQGLPDRTLASFYKKLGRLEKK